ncbi:unnamed protein product [Prunus armeniaca]|uniref:Cyclin N-terminal domain-containing protein n=1 Tax=Prunus armeniaca TaxID=36596 RepID=A0A6J5VM07_PRUAR|nr:unnamed protein product [Prunus armeniaca]
MRRQASMAVKDLSKKAEFCSDYLKLIRFCFTDSIVRKKVAAGCLWLASKPEECPKKSRQVIIVSHRMECRRENLPIEPLDPYSKDLKMELSKAERHILKEDGACCGVVYAAAWRFQVPLPENPPWWKAFDAEKSGIDEVCRVLAHLYSLPKAKYVPVCKDGDSFTFSNKSCNSQPRPIPKAAAEVNPESGGSKGVLAKLAIDKLKDSKESDESMPIEGEAIEDFSIKSKSERKMESSGNKSRDRDRERDKERERERDRDRDRDRDREKDRDRIATITIPPTLHGKRIAIDIILTLELIIKFMTSLFFS